MSAPESHFKSLFPNFMGDHSGGCTVHALIYLVYLQNAKSRKEQKKLHPNRGLLRREISYLILHSFFLITDGYNN